MHQAWAAGQEVLLVLLPLGVVGEGLLAHHRGCLGVGLQGSLGCHHGLHLVLELQGPAGRGDAMHGGKDTLEAAEDGLKPSDDAKHIPYLRLLRGPSI